MHPAGLVNRIMRRLGGRSAPGASSGYELLEEPNPSELDGWQITTVAERQHQAFAPLLQAARNGNPRLDFIVAAQAVAATGLADPLVVEVGCGSGYYSEVLALLLQRPVRYIGIDYAASMTAVARRAYRDIPFVTGDARRLALRAECCDVLISGTSLMHIAEYRQAIAESVRVTRRWCIFQTVPVMAQRATTLLRKQAYGGPVVEVIFNRAELEALFAAQGLVVRQVFDSIPYDVSSVVGERTWTLTFVCGK